MFLKHAHFNTDPISLGQGSVGPGRSSTYVNQLLYVKTFSGCSDCYCIVIFVATDYHAVDFDSGFRPRSRLETVVHNN